MCSQEPRKVIAHVQERVSQTKTEGENGPHNIYITRAYFGFRFCGVGPCAHAGRGISDPFRAAKRMIPGYKTVYSTCLIDVPRAARGHLTPGETAIFRNVNFGS